jgi:hypothetical protein
VVICATPQLGELGRSITIPWRVIAALITAQQLHGCGFVNLMWTHRSTLIWPHLGACAAGL